MGRNKLISDEDLLAIAREVFIEKGIGASTREIARRAGVSEAVLYQRHATKTDLFFSALTPPFLDLDQLLEQGPEGRDGLEHLEQVALGMLAYFRKSVPVLKSLTAHQEFNFEEFVERHPEAPMHRLRVGLVEMLKGQQARGEIGPGPTGPMAMTLYAAMHSLAIFEDMGAHGGKIDDSMVRGMVRALWNGIGA